MNTVSDVITKIAEVTKYIDIIYNNEKLDGFDRNCVVDLLDEYRDALKNMKVVNG